MTRIAINGFGRIGRQFLKAGWGKKGFKIVAINDLTDAKTLAYLLKYDTNYGIWDVPVKAKKNALEIDGVLIPVYSQRDPSDLPWKENRVDIVIESTGFFRTKELALKHVEAGAKKVIISAPAKDETPTFVFGVNHKDINSKTGEVINNASCTTNCVAPISEIIDKVFGVKKAMLTTVHGYTSTQSLVDSPHKDLRRGRAAAENIIPTSTGAAIATTKTVPNLKGKFDGFAIRVPVPTASLSDITFVTKEKVTVEGVNRALKRASRSIRWNGVLDTTADPIVSSDIVGNTHSAIVDLDLTRVVGGDLVKVVAWYDNEMGYASRLVDMAMFYSTKK